MTSLSQKLRRGPVVAGGVALLLVVGVFSALRAGALWDVMPEDRDEANKPFDPANPDAIVEPLPPAEMIGAPGLIEPREREVRVSPEVPGVVDSVPVIEGQRIYMGEHVVLLRQVAEEAAMNAARAEADAARAALALLEAGTREEDVRAAEADAMAAAARAKLSLDTLERVKSLHEKGSASADELDRAKAQASADEETAKAAGARKDALAAGARFQDIDAATARVAAAEARAQQAEATYQRMTIRAPIDGEVLQVLVRPGEYAQPGQALVVMGDTATLRARLDVDERDIRKVTIGMTGYVIADGIPDKFPGKVVEIARRMGRKNVRTDDPAERVDTRIIEVVLELEGEPKLPVGLRVSGFLQVDAAPADGDGAETEGGSSGGTPVPTRPSILLDDAPTAAEAEAAANAGSGEGGDAEDAAPDDVPELKPENAFDAFVRPTTEPPKE
jgi:HlyD family secretion protein